MAKATKILLKRSTVAGKAPTASIMETGEAFVNLAKGTEHLYFKNVENEVIATKLGPLDKELDETSEYGVENQAIAKKYNELKKQLDTIAQVYSIYGFARVNGDNSPAGTIFFGDDRNLEEITSHTHMGLTTKDGALYKRCANCRLDVAVDGTVLKIDGTDGDVMLFMDSKLYFLKGTVAAPAELNLGNRVELNIIAFGMSPFAIYGVNAKAFDPFALNPQFTVNCKIDGVDNAVCAHSIYNTKYPGTYRASKKWFNQTFQADGKGYGSQGISSMQSIWYAQGKNADQKTNRPYMGGYYEFYEIFIALMFCELKSVYHQSLDLFGTGCTFDNPAINESLFNEGMKGNSGVVFGQTNGVKSYSKLLLGATITNGTDTSEHPIEGLCGSLYGFTEMLEPIRILNDIAKAGLITSIWDGKTYDIIHPRHEAVFTYNTSGNSGDIIISNVKSNQLASGTGMIPGKKYYQVRSVPGTKGMADGVMTAVINIYVKMQFKKDTKVNGNDYTGGYAVYKMSHPVYRGMCLLDCMDSQMQGCHYVTRNNGASDKKYIGYFECAENVDNIPAQQAANIEFQGDYTKVLEIERGLTKKVGVHSALSLLQKKNNDIQAKKANYNASLLCYTEGGGSKSTGECAYLWFNGAEGSLPEAGKKYVHAVVVGNHAGTTFASARTVIANLVTDTFIGFGGRFAIPHLRL